MRTDVQTLASEIAHLREIFDGKIALVDARFNDRAKHLDSIFADVKRAAERAVVKADIAAEKRFDAITEFRAAFDTVINEHMPRKEAETRITALEDKLEGRINSLSIKIDDLKMYASKNEGRVGGNSTWAFLVGGIGILCAIVAIAVNFAPFKPPASATATAEIRTTEKPQEPVVEPMEK